MKLSEALAEVDAEVLDAQDAAEKYRSLGVLHRGEIQGHAIDGKVLVLRFEDTQVLDQPVGKRSFDALLRKHGTRRRYSQHVPALPVFSTTSSARSQDGKADEKSAAHLSETKVRARDSRRTKNRRGATAIPRGATRHHSCLYSSSPERAVLGTVRLNQTSTVPSDRV